MGRWGHFFAGFFSAFGLLILVGLFNILDILGPSHHHTIIRVKPSYNELLDKINDGSIAKASIRRNVVLATTKTGQFLDVWVFSPEKLADKMIEKGIRVETGGEDVSPPSLLGVLINWLPLIVFVLGFWFAMGRPLYRISAILQRNWGAANKE
jgi:ATP-dependent Zn protease